MSNLDRMVSGGALALVAYLVALGLGYVWLKAIRYPFTVGQRKMWTYYVLFISALPVLGECFLALALWVLPVGQSGAITVSALLVWMVIAFFLVRRMSEPGGRLSQGRQDLKQ